MIKVEQFSMNQKRSLLQLVVKGTQKEVWNFIAKLSIPVETNFNFREIKVDEYKISFRTSSEESCRDLSQSVISIIQKYI